MASLDRESVIFALTDGVGVHFGAASRKSFFEQLKRLETHEIFHRRRPKEQQFLVDLLAMAAFFQTVIVPIRSSGRFVSVLESAGASHLRVAGEKLGPVYARNAKSASDEFRYMLSRTEIPESLLTYATLKNFIHSAHQFIIGRQ